MHGGHIGSHFEKNYEDVRGVGQILEKKSMSKYENLIFYQRHFFCMAAILAAILEKKVDEDAPGTEPMLHRENSVKIRCRLRGEGGHAHRTQKSVQNFPPMDPYKP